jgi:hypothetical protein
MNGSNGIFVTRLKCFGIDYRLEVLVMRPSSPLYLNKYQLVLIWIHSFFKKNKKILKYSLQFL